MKTATIRNEDLQPLANLLNVFERVDINSGRLCGKIDVEFPGIGDCEISYLADESNLAIYCGDESYHFGFHQMPESTDQLFSECRELLAKRVKENAAKIAAQLIG